jgi:hypothetical protein
MGHVFRARDPDERWKTASDARLALRPDLAIEAHDAQSQGIPSPPRDLEVSYATVRLPRAQATLPGPAPPGVRRRTVPMLLGAALCTMVLGIVAWAMARPPIASPPSASLEDPREAITALSIAYVSARELRADFITVRPERWRAAAGQASAIDSSTLPHLHPPCYDG